VAGTVAVLAYARTLFPKGTWWGGPWPAVGTEVFDGVVYGLLAARGTFGWL